MFEKEPGMRATVDTDICPAKSATFTASGEALESAIEVYEMNIAFSEWAAAVTTEECNTRQKALESLDSSVKSMQEEATEEKETVLRDAFTFAKIDGQSSAGD